MTDPRPEFVYRFEKRGLFHMLFWLSLLLFAWVLVVLWGEVQGWGEDPGRWAVLPAVGWALIGLAVFAVFIAYALAHLIIKERPSQIYRLEGAGVGGSTTPSFLQPGETAVTSSAEPDLEPLPETMADAEEAPKA